MYGDNFVECATDPTACIQTDAFSLLGGYIVNFDDCQSLMDNNGPQQNDYTEEIFKSADADLGLSLGNGYIGKKIYSIPKLDIYENSHI